MQVFNCVAWQRYNYYVKESVDVSMLAPMPDIQMMNIHCRIPRHLLTNPQLNPSLKLLEQEVYEYYLYSLRKGIGKPADSCDVLLIRHRATKRYITEFELWSIRFKLQCGIKRVDFIRKVSKSAGRICFFYE